MNLRFEKIHGAGNDFVVVDARDAAGVSWTELAQRVCDRHRGIGADGVLAVGPSALGDLRMRLYNADGSEAEMCGNGIRCTAKFALDAGLTERTVLDWETGAGIIRTEVLERDGARASVRVDMGPPRFSPEEIPVARGGDGEPGARLAPARVDGRDLEVARVGEGRAASDGVEGLELWCVGMGNPHAVAFVADVAAFPLARVGPRVERHPAFPARTNFEIVQRLAPDRLRMRVWERGVGETLACGTGACAAAVAARLALATPARVEIEPPGGRLEVAWSPGGPAWLTGPAETVFSGEIDLAGLGVQQLVPAAGAADRPR